ncbi:MAG TPA: STM3941 family protein [Dyella sp.]|nr:STM3941 family protein [Dyella sp.]
MNQFFELRHSLWRNAVLFALCLAFTLPILLSHMWNIWYGALFFGLGSVLFGHRTFDRRVKVRIDERGIRDFRSSRWGLIAWEDIQSFEFTQIKGNYYLYCVPRDPAKFHRPSTKLGQWIERKAGFKMAVSLQNMAVDIAALSAFMRQMIASPPMRQRRPTSLETARLRSSHGEADLNLSPTHGIVVTMVFTDDKDFRMIRCRFVLGAVLVLSSTLFTLAPEQPPNRLPPRFISMRNNGSSLRQVGGSICIEWEKAVPSCCSTRDWATAR